MVISTYPLAQKNHWLHWLAAQTFLAGRSHFQAIAIQPENLSSKSTFNRLKSSILSFVIGFILGLIWGFSRGDLSGGQLLGQSLIGGIIGSLASCFSPRIFYRLLLGLLAASFLGSYFGLVYGHVLWPFGDVLIALPIADKSWEMHWETSLLTKLPNVILEAINLGAIICFATLAPLTWLGCLDQIIWQSRIKFKVSNIGYALLFSAIPIALLERAHISSGTLGFFLAFSSSLGFTLALKARKCEQPTAHYRSHWVTIALANSCYLLLLLVPSAMALVLHVGCNLFYTIQSYALVN